SWDALLDGGIVQSLASAGVVSDHYWTGDNGLAAGVTDLNQSCAGWTSGDGGSHASIGWYNTSSSSWLMYAANNQCNNSYRILCVAW
ncbi:MAG: hypothetical protein JXA20_11520, partial [Spirochaetes bacterium]|nr:hypothetical protein [Spirochaetota bacterium]